MNRSPTTSGVVHTQRTKTLQEAAIQGSNNPKIHGSLRIISPSAPAPSDAGPSEQAQVSGSLSKPCIQLNDMRHSASYNFAVKNQEGSMRLLKENPKTACGDQGPYITVCVESQQMLKTLMTL